MPGKQARKQVRKKAIKFVDLGAGPKFERIGKMAQRDRKGRARTLVAVDLAIASKPIPSGVKYTQRDAKKYLRTLYSTGKKVKVFNADNFFMDHLTQESGQSGRAALKMPIDPDLMFLIKDRLVKNGRLYTTTVKWHCEALAKKLRGAGFEVSFRPLTEKEASEGPLSTRAFHLDWKENKFEGYFGKDGWRLQRMVAVKR